RITQDHVDQNLMFAGTEFGVFVSFNRGQNWTELNGGLPTISIRDLTIHRRENDLVLATFGRGIYILDDISLLRNISDKKLTKNPAHFFPVKEALWYHQESPLGSYPYQGAANFIAKNPAFGATFSYFLRDGYKSLQDLRKEKEKKKNHAIALPKWSVLNSEMTERPPKIWFSISNQDGKVVRKVQGPTKKGFHRVAWDLKGTYASAINDRAIKDNREIWEPEPRYMVAPGAYSVSMFLEKDGKITPLGEPQSFNVTRLTEPHLQGKDFITQKQELDRITKVENEITAASTRIQKIKDRIKYWDKAIAESEVQPGELDLAMSSLAEKIHGLEIQVSGDPSRIEVGEKNQPTVFERLFVGQATLMSSTHGLTPTHENNLALAETQMKSLLAELNQMENEEIPKFEALLDQNNVPWTEGRKISK
ncbi:MAG: hypothetical protein AAF203_11275, partial [Pseudomonadota bacterium]